MTRESRHLDLERERRRYTRVRVRWPVTMLTASGPMEGEVENISLGGAFICCDGQPGLRETFRLVIKVPHPRQFLMARARVTRSDTYNPQNLIGTRGIGVRFVEMPEADRQLLEQILSGPGAE